MKCVCGNMQCGCRVEMCLAWLLHMYVWMVNVLRWYVEARRDIRRGDARFHVDAFAVGRLCMSPLLPLEAYSTGSILRVTDSSRSDCKATASNFGRASRRMCAASTGKQPCVSKYSTTTLSTTEQQGYVQQE